MAKKQPHKPAPAAAPTNEKVQETQATETQVTPAAEPVIDPAAVEAAVDARTLADVEAQAELVPMAKGGEELLIHPDCVNAHSLVGWKLL